MKWWYFALKSRWDHWINRWVQPCDDRDEGHISCVKFWPSGPWLAWMTRETPKSYGYFSIPPSPPTRACIWCVQWSAIHQIACGQQNNNSLHFFDCVSHKWHPEIPTFWQLFWDSHAISWQLRIAIHLSSIIPLMGDWYGAFSAIWVGLGLPKNRWMCRPCNNSVECFAHRRIVCKTHAVVNVLARNSAFPPVISYPKYSECVGLMSRHGMVNFNYGWYLINPYILMGEFERIKKTKACYKKDSAYL